MAVIKKTSFAENIDKYNTFVQDTNPNSTYFNVTELPQSFTGGKNAFLIAGSNELVADTLIKIEIKDAAGNIIYHEPGEGRLLTNINGEQFITEYYEGVSKVIAVYVYPDTTAYGPCTITILGELSSYYDENGILTPIPINWEGTYNVKWQRNVNVNPTLANTTKIRFYRRPSAIINELISPIFRIENGLKIDSGVNQSFAEIKLSQLETFAGDVKRIKVFRTSEGDISDFDLIQDILVESKELLTTTQLTGSVKGNTGIFTSETLPSFWNTGSLTAELTSNRVENGVKLNGSGKFVYTSSLNIQSTNTYELNLDAFYSSSTASNLEIYISGSDGGNVLISTLNGITPTKNLLDTVISFKLDSDFQSGSLYFLQSQGEWHLGNISLRLSEDTAFSPDEVSFITTMPTVIGNETFNFKFELYDVNNNFVPVAVTQSANFTGGTAGVASKLLTFDSDRTAFRFSTGSFGNPAFQQLGFKVSKSNLSGSVTYARSVFNTLGNYIEPTSYAGTYPGTLTNVSDAGATLTIANFSGSVSSVLVGSITYTASCDGLEQFETIYRFEDGENAPGLFVTSNTNQFIYKATDLSLNPSGQLITIEAKRKNLASATIPLTVNSGSGKPPLTFVSTNGTNGVDTYTISGTSYPFLSGSTTYFISGSDQFGNEFSDAITITPIKILDGLSATLTNDNASLPALSNGFVASGSFLFTSGSINVKVGNETITFDDDNDGNRANNTFAITNLSGVGCTPNGGEDSNPSENAYSITSLSADSGSLDITIDYKDGAGDSTNLIKTVTYTKNKKAAPVLKIEITNNAQSVTAKSTGVQLGTFLNPIVTVSETYNGVTTTKPIDTLTATSSDISSILTTHTTGTIALNGRTLTDGTDNTIVSITATITDSEGSSRDVTDSVSLSKIKNAAPITLALLSSETQTILSSSIGYAAPSTFTVNVTEGGSNYTFDNGLASINTYYISSITGGTNSNGTITPITPTTTTGTTTSITITYKNSEGTTGTITKTHKVAVSLEGSKGVDGTPGSSGGDGKRTATGMIHYQVTSTNAPANPTATSFTFSNGTFSGLTSQWGIGAPTYASGNTNKYWYATYTVVETTAGGGTGVPSFGASTQAIGFSGLVSFTAANNVSDGSNALSFGVAGATLINGSNISTGKIISTNFVAGTPFTTAGSIIDLDNGRIATKTFYVDGNGDAVFKGTVQIGGTDLTAANTLNANTTATQVGLGSVQNLNAQSQAQTGLIAGTTITGGGITLSNGGNIKGGQTGFNAGTGFFLGYDGAAYKFSIGNASTKGITWDGTTLSIGGDVNIGATLASTVVSNASSALTNAATAQTTANTANAAAGTAQTTANNAGTAAATAQTTADAKVAPSQVLNHIGGTNNTKISGGVVTTGQIKSGNHGGTADGSDFASSGTSIDLDTGGISAKNFRITTAGAAFFKGDISGASGTFSGNLSGATISGGTIRIGSGVSVFSADSNGIYLGNETFASAPFRVTTGGSLSATNANLTGNITATGGTLGGWVIDGTILRDSASRLQLNPGSPSIDIYDTSNAKRLTFKFGAMTSPFSAANISIDPPSVNINPPTNSYGIGFHTETIRSSNYNTFYVSEAGTYFATSYTSNTIYNTISTGFAFQGYASAAARPIITDDSGNEVAYMGGVYGDTQAAGASIDLVGYNSGVYLSFPSIGTYRVYFEYSYDLYIEQGTAFVNGISANDPLVNVGIQLNIAEITTDGFQVISSVDSYCTIRRGGNYSIDTKGSLNVDAPDGSFIYLNGLVHPYTGNTNDLGTTGNRWRRIYLNNNPVVGSDVRIKNNIVESDLGLDFVNSLNPVKYKLNASTSPRYHYGLIAQEVTSSLQTYGLTTDDVGFMTSASFQYTEEDIELWKTKPNWKSLETEISASMAGEMGIAYTELISPMIKAIQQLSTKVNELEAKISGSI